MSEDARRPEYTPLNLHPFVGLDLGERWGREVGELSQRLTHVEQAVNRLETKTDALDAKVEEIAHTVARHTVARHVERFGRVYDKSTSLGRSLDDGFYRLKKKLDEGFASLEKKLDNNTRLLWGMFTAMLAAIIIQKFI